MKQKVGAKIRDRFTELLDSPTHDRCTAEFSWDFRDQDLIVKVVEEFDSAKHSHPKVKRPSSPAGSPSAKVKEREVLPVCHLLHAISEVSGVTQNWYSRAKRLQIAIKISPEAQEYLATCQNGSSFTFDRLLALPTKEATHLLSECLLVCVAKLSVNSKTVTGEGLNYRQVAATLLADSLPYRHFSPIDKLRALVRPLIAG